MDDQNKKRNTGWVYVLWPDLDLTPEQAQIIAGSDKRLRPFSPGSNFSEWENWDWEFYVFSGVLNPEQLKRYVYKRGQKIKEHEQRLVEDDNSDLISRGIQKALAEINYLETDFLPAVEKKFRNHYSIEDPKQTKYNYLKAEFKSYLDEKHRQIVSNHFGYSRVFQPNTLKKELLTHKIEAMYPQFPAFEKKMDDITKSVVEFLKYPPGLFERGKKEMSAILENLGAFRQKAWEEEIKWIKEARILSFTRNIEDTRSEEDRNKELYFSLLLIDKDYYGYK